MNAVDPLIYAQRLTAAGVPAEQAQIHAEIIREVLASMAIDRLESKVDKGLAELNNKIDNGLAELNTKIDSGLAELNIKIDRTKAELEARMDRLISDLRKELMAEIQKSKWSCVRWMFGIAVSVGTLQGAAIVMAMRWLA
ncbi:hypothetical protein [Pseudoduganella sp. R-34]|uniref:hypothetical protein n=1 Tax=Pseudoduganella sp. R-34 TaxID=3404062 RepID=UPI003CE700B6